MTGFLIFLGIVVLVGLWLVAQYNRLVGLRNKIENAWSQVDVELRRRFDLIPNLVETVKGYAAHESEVFEKVSQARSAMMNARTVGEQAGAQNMITDALKSLFAVSEAYPELKANQNFMMLQQELSATEEKIAFARQFYNDQVMSLNTMIQNFPTNAIANACGFQEREYFPMEDAARENVKVDFSA